MDRIQKYFPELTPNQIEQFKILKPVYTEWNSMINVISRKDIEELYIRHILHSMAIAKVIQFKPGSRVLDVGTGGGFPGIPLAILFPDVFFHLVDSIGKKITVVEAVSKAIGLKNIKAEKIRAEESKSKYDFIVSRAVSSMDKFVPLIKSKIRKENKNDLPNGILALKGGLLLDELINFKNKVTIFDISDFFKEEFFETKKIIHLPIKYSSK